MKNYSACFTVTSQRNFLNLIVDKLTIAIQIPAFRLQNAGA